MKKYIVYCICWVDDNDKIVDPKQSDLPSRCVLYGKKDELAKALQDAYGYKVKSFLYDEC